MISQVFLSNTNILQADLFDEALTGTTTPGQGGSGSNEGLFYTVTFLRTKKIRKQN